MNVTRLVIAFVLLATATICIARFPVSYLPEANTSGLEVEYEARSAWDLTRLNHEILIPTETAIRSLGSVKSIYGTVGVDGFDLTVELASGANAEKQTARLSTELITLRKKNPDDSFSVAPTTISRSDLPLYAFITGDVAPDDLKNIRETIRSAPGVRDVRFWRSRNEELSVSLLRQSNTQSVADEIKQHFDLSYVGEVRNNGMRFPIFLNSDDPDSIRELPLGDNQIPLQQLADITDGLSETKSSFRVDGVSGAGMAILRERNVSLLEFDNSVQKAIRDLNRQLATQQGAQKNEIRIIENPAAPARRMIRFALLGAAGWLVAAFGVGFLNARWRGGLLLSASLFIALSIAVNLQWLLQIPFHVLTFCGLATGLVLGSSIPILTTLGRIPPKKLFPVIFAAIIPWIALPLVAPQWSVLLNSAAKTFAIGIFANLLSSLLVSAPIQMRRPSSPRSLKLVLRDPATALLIFSAISIATLSNQGIRLSPTGSGLNTERKYLSATLILPEGSTLQETEAALSIREDALTHIPGIEMVFSTATEESANLWIRFDRNHESESKLRELEQDIKRLCSPGGGIFELETSSEQTDSDLWQSHEMRAFAGKNTGEYRVVLRSIEPDSIIHAAMDIRDYLHLTYKLDPESVRTTFAKPGIEILLEPQEDATSEEFSSALRSIREMTSLSPQTLEVSGSKDRDIIVRSILSPHKTADLPYLSDVLSRIVVDGNRHVPISRVVRSMQILQTPRLTRENGRYTAPLEIQFSQYENARRSSIDRSLSQMKLPAGVDLETPDLSFPLWTRERARTIALVAAVPALLFALFAILCNSLSKALGAWFLFVAGLSAAVAPLLLSLAQSDAITSFLIIAAICGSTAPLLATLTTGPLRPLRVYRDHRNLPSLCVSFTILVTLAILPALLLSDMRDDIWAGPLYGAFAATLGCMAGTVWGIPAFMNVLANFRPVPVREELVFRSTDFSMVPVLEASNLVKTYGSGHRALSSVSFELWPGITGLLGPNGAGKTTLLRILTGLVTPTRGCVRFSGDRLTARTRRDFRNKVGFLPQEFNAYPGFSGEQFLNYWALEYGIADPSRRRNEIARLLELSGLSEDAKRKARDYSGGMLKRLGIARALLADPEILILDEPTTGLDIESRHRFREVLLGIAEERIILLSTHIASDIEAVATRLLVLDHGQLRFDGIPTDLLVRVHGRVFETTITDRELLEVSHRYRLTRRVRVLDGIRVRGVVRPGEPLPGKSVEPHLEEAYLAYLGSV